MILFEQLSVLLDQNGYSENDKLLFVNHIFPFSDKIVKMIENHSPITQIHEVFLQEEDSHFLWAGKKKPGADY